MMAALALACTDTTAAGPGAGTFVLSTHFAGHRQTSFTCTSNGCTITGKDSTEIDETRIGTITFDSLFGGPTGTSVTLNLGQCAPCLVSDGSVGHAWRTGDSIRVIFTEAGSGALNPTLELLGIYRGDGISGQIEALDHSSSANDTYWGTFVAIR